MAEPGVDISPANVESLVDQSHLWAIIRKHYEARCFISVSFSRKQMTP